MSPQHLGVEAGCCESRLIDLDRVQQAGTVLASPMTVT